MNEATIHVHMVVQLCTLMKSVPDKNNLWGRRQHAIY